MVKQVFKLVELLEKILRWLTENFTSLSTTEAHRYVSPLLRKRKSIEDNRGQAELVSFCKDTRSAFLIYLSGSFPRKKVGNVPVTKIGIPKVLGRKCIEQVEKKNIAVRRLILTCLFSTRALSLGTDPDFKTVTDRREPASQAGGEVRLNLNSVYSNKNRSKFFAELGYRKHHKVPGSLRWKEFHFTTKSGPNGHALYSAYQDLKALRGNTPLINSIKVLGGKKISHVIEKSLSVLDSLIAVFPRKKNTLRTRKLSWFPDKESKVRVVAVGDFWSQTVLRPLHDYLFRILRKIPQDCTFNQGSFKDKSQTWKEFDSCDLTAATDRFPIQVQSFVLKGLLPEEYVKSWLDTRVGYPFEAKGYGQLSYAVGNPRGFYSSWNSFAVSHHYVVFCCCQSLGIDWKSAKYCLLGDDILFGDRPLALLYKSRRTSLGVKFSPLKSHEGKSLYEFAKRIVFEGSEITPFPVSSLKESGKKYYLLVNLLLEEERKGWVPVRGTTVCARSFLDMVSNRDRVIRNRLRPWIKLCELTLKRVAGLVDAEAVVEAAFRTANVPYTQGRFSLEECENILKTVALVCFTESREGKSLDGKQRKVRPFGELALNATLALTTPTQDSARDGVLVDLLGSGEIPVLSIYGKFTEKFLELGRQAVSLDTAKTAPGHVNWPLVLNTVAIPLDDRVFSRRSKYYVPRSAALVGRQLVYEIPNNFGYLGVPYTSSDLQYRHRKISS